MASTGFGSSFRHLRGLFQGRSVGSLEDAQLLARYDADRDEAAFEALVCRHGSMVLTICRAVLKNEHDVEDAFQATFLVLARKAHSIRGANSLGGWLHRVAYRASVQASVQESLRRRKETDLAALVHSPRLDPELVHLLHEEIDRLPEGYRLPVVLCDLEGLSYDQAARQLRWSVPTLRNRLARGRQRLKARLTRQGVMASALGVLLASEVSASVPNRLLRSALAAALGGPTSRASSLLTQTLLQGILMAKIKTATTIATALAALGMLATAVFATVGRPPIHPAASQPPIARANAQDVAKPADHQVTIQGRVVDPGGKPVEGAIVRPAFIDRADVSLALPFSRTGEEGHFAITLARPTAAPRTQEPWLVASAPGHAHGWVTDIFRANPADLTIKLVDGGSSIKGQVVDLEGRPVGSAQVVLTAVWFDPSGSLDPWLADVRNGKGLPITNALQRLPLRVVSVADDEGKFSTVRVGRDRVASLRISGSGIATTQVYVMGRDEPEIRSMDKTAVKAVPVVIHGSRFSVVVAPSKLVEGTVRDQDTGQPVAGLSIKAGVFDPFSRTPSPDVVSLTSDKGRYRLDGLPRATAYRLVVSGRPKLPYPDVSFKATVDTPGLEPAVHDFSIKRGVVVQGRVVDQVKGGPVSGHVFYFASAGNPLLSKYPGFAEAVDLQWAPIRADGSYEIIGLPGPGWLAVINFENRYRAASGLQAIRGYDANLNGFHTAFGPIPASGYNVFVATDFDTQAASTTVNLSLDPGRSLTIRVVDPEGQPLGGTQVIGQGDLSGPRAFDQESANLEVTALDPSRPRRVTVTQPARKLVGSVWLKGDETGPLVLPLTPWGTIQGRIIDDENQPRKNLALVSLDQVRGGSQDQGTLPARQFTVGEDGRFRIEGLVPGLRYGARVLQGGKRLGDLFQDQTVAPGEVKDLGDLKINPTQKPGST